MSENGLEIRAGSQAGVVAKRPRIRGRSFSEMVSETGLQNGVGNRPDGTNSMEKVAPEPGRRMAALPEPLPFKFSEVDGPIFMESGAAGVAQRRASASDGTNPFLNVATLLPKRMATP